MAITRRAADESVLRDPAAMRTYLHDMANLFLNAGMEMQIISRVARRRLSHAPARGQLMSQAEKDAAAKRISRDMHRTALLMSHCSKMIGNAEGILTEVFVPSRGRNNRNNGNGQKNTNQNGNRSSRGNAA
jgi:hypothetical protein